jgi:hypothetical protein
MFEFPSMKAIHAFWNSPEYVAVKELRRDAATLDIWAAREFDAMSNLLTPPTLESVLRDLHDSQIDAGIETLFNGDVRVWLGDELNVTIAEATVRRADKKWPDQEAALWLHETALRLFPDNPYAKRHSH